MLGMPNMKFQVTSAMQMPMMYFYLCLPVGLIPMILACVLTVGEHIMELKKEPQGNNSSAEKLS
jgi:TRAP-type C4-dicarboxylate transport system permease small subunit